MTDRSIAITGMACVFPGAKSLDEFWRNIVNGVDSVTEIPPGRLNFADRFPIAEDDDAYVPCRRGGFLPADLRFDPRQYGIMPNIVANGDPDQFVMLDVAAKALADAGVGDDSPVRENTDVIVGRGGYLSNKYGEFYLRSEGCNRFIKFLSERLPNGKGEFSELERQIREALPKLEPDSISTCMPNFVASRVANRLNLHGAAYTVDAACASSLLAVEHSLMRLRAGQCDLAIAGGVHLFHVPGFWYVFTKLGALSPSSTIRPFDRRADGVVPAEGAGAVVLKRLADAQRDGDRIYAIIRGSGSSSDGRDTAIFAPSSAGQVRALQRAYRDAQVDPASIGYLETHGTGTPVGDETEINTIKTFFGSRGLTPTGRVMGTVKSMIGHAMPAAGIAALIRTTLAISNKVLPPTLHCEQPHPALKDSPFYVLGHTRPWIHQVGTPRRAGVSALGFGGSNAHIVLEEVPSESAAGTTGWSPRPIVDQKSCDSELVVLSGESINDVLAKLSQLESQLDLGLKCALGEMSFSLLQELDINHRVKLAVVCPDVQQLSASIARGREIVEAGVRVYDDDGWFFTPDGHEPIGKIGCVFPGVGFPGLIGNYPDHLMELCLHFPEVRKEFDQIEARDQHSDDPVPTSVIFSPPGNLSDDEHAQLKERIAAMKVVDGEAAQIEIHPAERNIAASGVTVTNWLSWKMLEKLGVPADMLCGQSQGEMAALCASGIFDIREIIPRFWEALSVSPMYAGKGRLAFVQATEAQLEKHLASFPTVSIAIHVAPQAQVLGGEESEIDALGRQLREDHILTQVLPYPPIHTPQLSYLRDELMEVIDAEITFGEQKIPIYSAVIEDFFPSDPEGIRSTALANLDQPVRFWQTIHKMYDAGARVFIQVGGGSIAANIKTVLPKDDIVGTAVDLDHRDPITQLNHLCATLLTAGVRFQPARLFEHRAPRKVDWRSASQLGQQQAGMPLRFDWTPFDVAPQRSETQPVTTEEFESVVPPPDPTPARSEALAAPERRMPFIDSISEYVPNERITVDHLLDINGDLFLRDHVFIQAPGVKPIEHCLPVLPLTMILEAMAETAACLAPGLGVIGLENVSAQRWVALEDRKTMPIQLRGERLADVGDGATRIRVQLEAEGITRATAVVLLASNYQQRIDIAFPPITGQMDWPFHADEIYRDGHTFHGPEFQAVSQLLEFGDNGCTAELIVRPKDRLFASTSTPELLLDPVILDATAQAVGLWAVALGVSILPSGLERIEFYRPTPPPGTRVICRTHVTEVDTNKRIVRSNVEIIDQEGLLWLRIVGFKDWLYRYPEQTRDFRRKPQEFCISEEQPLVALPQGSICRSVARPAVQDVTISWLQRLFLHEDEREEFERLKLPKRQWEWIMGRIAAKDAVRVWHARESGAGQMLHPAAFAILKDEQSRPYVAASAMIPNPPSISISHSMDRAVAIAGASPVGIDLETSHPDPAVLEFACSNAEREIIRTESANRPEASWPARLWAAKEAASKAMGTGLNGRPADFEAIDWEDDGQFVIVHHPTRNRFVVATHLDNGNVIAVTSYDNSWNGSNGELEHEFAK